MSNYSEMSNDELLAENKRLQEVREASKAELTQIQAELNVRHAEGKLDDITASLDDAGKARLAQKLAVKGIESAESVGTPTRK